MIIRIGSKVKLSKPLIFNTSEGTTKYVSKGTEVKITNINAGVHRLIYTVEYNKMCKDVSSDNFEVEN